MIFLSNRNHGKDQYYNSYYTCQFAFHGWKPKKALISRRDHDGLKTLESRIIHVWTNIIVFFLRIYKSGQETMFYSVVLNLSYLRPHKSLYQRIWPTFLRWTLMVTGILLLYLSFTVNFKGIKVAAVLLGINFIGMVLTYQQKKNKY